MQVTIPAGTRITTRGAQIRTERPTRVTVRHSERTRAGNLKVTWKRNGYRATAVLKNI